MGKAKRTPAHTVQPDEPKQSTDTNPAETAELIAKFIRDAELLFGQTVPPKEPSGILPAGLHDGAKLEVYNLAIEGQRNRRELWNETQEFLSKKNKNYYYDIQIAQLRLIEDARTVAKLLFDAGKDCPELWSMADMLEEKSVDWSGAYAAFKKSRPALKFGEWHYEAKAEGNDQGGDEDIKNVAVGLQGLKLTAKQKEQMRVTMEESVKKIMAGAQAVRDKQDEYQRGLARVADTIASIQPAPRVDTEILEEPRKLNAAQQGQLPGAKKLLPAPEDVIDVTAKELPLVEVRTAPMSLTELCRRYMNRTVRADKIKPILEQHQLRREHPKKNLWTICVDRLDKAMRERMMRKS
ncbi:MAG: hypothetical protein JXA11_15710 [Phycisphaerae bacterium]|nr:hypothetical protein [Phycisphaerae bacterium]